MPVLVYTADDHLGENEVRLLNANRAVVRSGIEEIEATPFDHVVRTVSDLPDPVGGFIDLTTGSWAFAAPITLPGVLRVAAGQTVYIHGMGWNNVVSNTGAVLRCDGTAVVEAMAMESTTARCILVNNANAELWLSNCSLDANTECVNVTLGSRFHATAGLWVAGGDGLVIDGDVDELTLLGVTADVTDFVDYNAGTVRSCILSSCQATPSAFGVVWPAANIPSAGLLIDGCHFSQNTAALFNGFSAASARVNVKAVTHQVGLQTETAIVP